jgi:hypothetical protein
VIGVILYIADAHINCIQGSFRLEPLPQQYKGDLPIQNRIEACKLSCLCDNDNDTEIAPKVPELTLAGASRVIFCDLWKWRFTMDGSADFRSDYNSETQNEKLQKLQKLQAAKVPERTDLQACLFSWQPCVENSSFPPVNLI